MGKYVMSAVQIVVGAVLMVLPGGQGLGIALIGSGISSAVAKAKLPSTGSQTSWRADPWAGVPYAMGRTAVAGNIIFRNSHGSKNEFQNFVTVYSCGGPVESFDKIFLDQTVYPEAGPPTGDFPTIDHIREMHQLGETPASGVMLFSESRFNPPEWTSAHKLSGYAACHIVLKWDTEGSHTMTQPPQVLREGHWVKLYDPRLDDTYPGGAGDHRWADPSDTAAHEAAKATWEWSEDPYLHALMWLLGRWERDTDDVDSVYKRIIGVGIPIERILVEQFVEGANTCDANEWTLGGVVYSTDDKWDVFKKMLQAGGGEPVRHGTKIGCIVNMPRVSLATITEADIIGEIGVQATQARRDRINACIPRGRFEDLAWEIDAASPVVIDDYVTFDGRQRNMEVTYDLVQIAAGEDPTQLVQLARYEIENAREFGPITMPLKLRWYGYKPGDCVTVTNSEVGLNGQLVLIRGRNLDPATGVVTLSGRSETTAKHAFALGQTGTAPATPTVTVPPAAPNPASDAFTLTSSSLTANGTQIPALLITVDVPDEEIDGVDSIIFEYRVYDAGNGDDDNWLAAGIEPPTLVTQNQSKVISGLLDLTDYEVSIRYRMGKLISQTRLILGPVTTDASIVPIPTMPRPFDVTIEQDYTGAPLSGYPVLIRFTRLIGGYDVTATTDFEITAVTGSLDYTSGSPNTTINDSFGDPDRGLLEVDTPGIGRMTVKTSRPGEPDLYQTVEIKAHQALPPTASSDTTPGDVTSTSDNVTSDVLAMEATDTSIQCSAVLTFRCGSPGANLNSNVKGKFIRSTSPAMTSPSDVGSFVTGSPEVAPIIGGGKGGDTPGDDGHLTVAQNDTGRTIGVTYYYQFVEQAIATPDAYPIHQFGTIQVTA